MQEVARHMLQNTSCFKTKVAESERENRRMERLETELKGLKKNLENKQTDRRNLEQFVDDQHHKISQIEGKKREQDVLFEKLKQTKLYKEEELKFCEGHLSNCHEERMGISKQCDDVQDRIKQGTKKARMILGERDKTQKSHEQLLRRKQNKEGQISDVEFQRNSLRGDLRNLMRELESSVRHSELITEQNS